MNIFLKILAIVGLLIGHISLNAAIVTPRPGLIIFKGKLLNVGAESDKFLWYTPDSRDPRGFQLTVNRYIERSSTFTIEYSKLICATGEPIQQELFGNSGEYYVGNIITSDKKYLLYDVDKKQLSVVTKIPKPDYANFTWLIFHCKQLDQYMFWPLFQQPMFLQKFRLPDVIDVILFQKSGTDGRNYIYWKLIPEGKAIAD